MGTLFNILCWKMAKGPFVHGLPGPIWSKTDHRVFNFSCVVCTEMSAKKTSDGRRDVKEAEGQAQPDCSHVKLVALAVAKRDR